MDRRDIQRKLVASETFCFAGSRDFPKVYETLTRHHVEPDVSHGSGAGFDVAEDGDGDGYRVTVDFLTGATRVTALAQE